MAKQSGVICLFVKGGKMLLVKRESEDQKYPDRWTPPSGHIEEGETKEEALVREMQEELDVTPTDYELVFSIKHMNGGEHYYYVFRISKWDGEIKNNSENVEFGWFTFEEAEQKRIPRAEEYMSKVREIMKSD